MRSLHSANQSPDPLRVGAVLAARECGLSIRDVRAVHSSQSPFFSRRARAIARVENLATELANALAAIKQEAA